MQTVEVVVQKLHQRMVAAGVEGAALYGVSAQVDF